MSAHKLTNSLSRFVTLFALVVALALQTAISPAPANEIKTSSEDAKSAALSNGSGLEYLLAVHPAIGKVNQRRTVFLNQAMPLCPKYGFSFDTSAMESRKLVTLRKLPLIILCPSVGHPTVLVSFEFEFTPATAGPLTIRDENSGTEITIQTLPDTVASKFDTNGMWFDSSTNGSGISLHHSRATTDIAFGTWFLFNNNSDSRWFGLQSANWQQDGNVLEGLLIQTRGGCPDITLAACPAVGGAKGDPPQTTTFAVTPSLARITFQSSTRAHAEVRSLGGKVLFTSELTKLQY